MKTGESRAFQKMERVVDSMKRLSVDIGEEEYAALKELAESRKVTVADILGNYVRDLTAINSNGSDERMFARQYFERSWVSWLNLEE